MATPSKMDLMMRQLAQQKRMKKDGVVNFCNHQFPDCPLDRAYNEDCKKCPYYNKELRIRKEVRG